MLNNDLCTSSDKLSSDINVLPALAPPLIIDAGRFMEAYNLDVSDYIERNTFRESQSKGKGTAKEIWYLSHSHAMRLFRTMFPELSIYTIENPDTGGFIFREIDDRGYFVKGFIHDGVRRTETYIYPVLDTTGQSVSSIEKYPDKKDATTGKVYQEGKYKADMQLFAKAIWRAHVRWIAFTTGISLKLWTGDDLGADVRDAKQTIIDKVYELAAEYKDLKGVAFTLPELSYISPIGEIQKLGKDLLNQVKELRAAKVIEPKATTTTTTAKKSTETKVKE